MVQVAEASAGEQSDGIMTSSPLHRRRLLVDGIVQGVGFRPFVYNLARAENLSGFVTNTSDGVVIEIQGPGETLDRFTIRLESEAPPLADIVSLHAEAVELDSAADTFVIKISIDTPGTRTIIPPDVATCADCLREILDPENRRFGYAFTNCTNCGPRWTIIGRIPYDRPHTSMARFTMCPVCQAEYDDPGDRRFHAQPNACSRCGPRVWLEDVTGPIEGHTDPLEAAAGLLAVGRIIAIKGLGGFHLAVRANDDRAVVRLRRRKNREAKPLAVMVRDVGVARNLAIIGDAEEKLMTSPRAPIVLVGKTGDMVAPSVAAGHRRLGLMLPYTPLHHLLFDNLRVRGVDALVMTSGNASDEPICLSNDEAVSRLKGIADSWLLHDRDIVRRADDSVIQVLDGETLFFRRSRGYAPVPVPLEIADGPDILAVGPELKNTVCLLKENRAFLSPHIGDLENLKAFEFFTETVSTLQDVLESEPQIIAHDLHPGYFSTRWAKEQARRSVKLEPVQHHHAHLAAVMAEHGLTDPVIGLIMDGTGYGTDGTIWGGEILAGDLTDFRRVGHFDPVALPGGDAAIRAPWRTAVSYLRHAYGGELPELPWFEGRPVAAVVEMLDKGVNSPLTSSCGRLFDAVAAMTGGWLEAEYEAQAAIELMALTTVAEVAAAPSFFEKAPRGALVENFGQGFVIPVTPIVRGVVSALSTGASAAEISARFHRTLIDLFVVCAQEAAERTGIRTVVMGGGVFQNEILLSQTVLLLEEAGVTVHRPILVPANDGAVALGQAAVVRARTNSVIRREN
jgi:hydrogenase maturation protein HypF